MIRTQISQVLLPWSQLTGIGNRKRGPKQTEPPARCNNNQQPFLKVHRLGSSNPRRIVWGSQTPGMNAHPSTVPKTVDDAERMRRARLDFVAASLRNVVWLNPLWALLSIVPFTGVFPVFGTVS